MHWCYQFNNLVYFEGDNKKGLIYVTPVTLQTELIKTS